MKIYYDEQRNTIMLGDNNRHFANSNLEAVEIDGKISIRYVGSISSEMHLSYSEIKTITNEIAGSNISEVTEYLNSEFSKDKPKGIVLFNLFSTNVNVINDRIKKEDIILVTTNTIIKEQVFVSEVLDGGFTVSRNALNALNGLTSGLSVMWQKL